MTIKDIYDANEINLRSFNVCNDNGLIDLVTILKHYEKYKTFNNIRNCGIKSNEELIKLCVKYSNPTANSYVISKDIFSKIILNLSEKQLNEINNSIVSYSENLSARTRNSIRLLLRGKLDIININEKILSNDNFVVHRMRSIGNNSIPELIQFIELIKATLFQFLKDNNNLIKIEIPISQNSIVTLISNFTRSQREIVNSFIEINTTSLSNRAKKAITSFLDGNLKIRNISARILINDRFDFKEIKNVGSLTVTELKTFIDSISNFIKKVSLVENENELISLRNRFFIERTFSISSIPNDILESQSIFKLVDFLLYNNAIFEKNENLIFKKTCKIYDKQLEQTLDDTAAEMNISRERVRQIRKNIIENLFNSLSFIRNIEDDLYQKYNIDQNQNLINVEDHMKILINATNNTNFSNEFITFIIYTYNSDKFDIVGEIEDVLLSKYFNSRERHNWNNFYLVKVDICRLFNFNDFVNDVEKRTNERIEESYSFNFKSYLMRFCKSPNFDSLNDILEVAEKILNTEFGIYIDTDDNLKFTRNSAKQAYEYAYEALKIIGEPSKVIEIKKKIEELHPNYETNEMKVRVSMKRQNGFVPIGRRSIFGLKEWENEIENFKGGTIRNIVSEYLESEVEPKHITEITEYVLNYRPNTYEKSILDNLKADETGIFNFFKNSTIGLIAKQYDTSFVQLNRIENIDTKSWEESYFDFVQFINSNKRLPYSSGCPEDEIRLYRWYKIQEGKFKNGKLKNEKSDLLSNFIFQFENGNINNKRKLNSLEKYNSLKCFVIANKRLPSANKIGEQNMYQFYYKQRRIYEKGDLDQIEENQFIEIAKLIQNSKNENKRN